MSAALITVVREVVDAANAVHDASKAGLGRQRAQGARKADAPVISQAIKNYKENSRKISKFALEVATSIENTAAAAHHRGEAARIAVSEALPFRNHGNLHLGIPITYHRCSRSVDRLSTAWPEPTLAHRIGVRKRSRPLPSRSSRPLPSLPLNFSPLHLPIYFISLYNT